MNWNVRRLARFCLISVSLLALVGATAPWLLITAQVAHASGITIDVTHLGALGDGTTDDSDAFQRAIDRLEPTGGTLYVPPNHAYVVGDVIIKSKYPITISGGGMGLHSTGGGPTVTHNDRSCIRPKSGCSFIFKWERDTTAYPAAGFGCSGGIESIAFNDIDTGFANERAVEIGTAAVWIEDVTGFLMRDCRFQWLKGTALKHEVGIYVFVEDCIFARCGDTGKPVIDIGNAAGPNYAYLWTDNCYIENNYATHISLRAFSHLFHRDSYHEDIAGTVGGNIYVDGTLGLVKMRGCICQNTGETNVILGYTHDVGNSIEGCTFAGAHGTNPTISILAGADRTVIDRVTIRGYGQTVHSILNAADDCQITNVKMIDAGGINTSGNRNYYGGITVDGTSLAAGQYIIKPGPLGTLNGAIVEGNNTAVCEGVFASDSIISNVRVRGLNGGDGIISSDADDVVTGCKAESLNGGTPFIKTAGMVFLGNDADTGTSHLTYASIPIPITSFYESVLGAPVTNATDPSIDGSGVAHGLLWSAGNVDEVMALGVSLPEGFDGTQDVTVALEVASDTTNAATFTIGTYWNGGSLVTDTATDGAASATPHTITGTIAAADIPDGATYFSLFLTPAAHGTDPIKVYNVRVEVVHTPN